MDSPKYPRTFHLPYSKGATNDDKIATDISAVINTSIVITEKIDGSNTSLEFNGCFARTHSGPPTHQSFDGLKSLHSHMKYRIPKNTQLFGEWVFARHSIEYSELPGYFLLFNVRESYEIDSKWLSWDMVELWAQEIEVPTVPVLFQGTVTSEDALKKLVDDFMNKPSKCGGLTEGIVVRTEDGFLDSEFSNKVFKCVRENHVQTSTHWREQEIIKNKLISIK